MKKESYNNWNKLKQKINFWESEKNYPKAWEIWYVNIWINIWNEVLWKWDDFKRPVLVIKKLWNIYFCVSMTSKWKDENIFYHKINDKYFDKKSYLIKSQLKSIDKKRFIEKMWKLRDKDFYNIKKELQDFIFKKF